MTSERSWPHRFLVTLHTHGGGTLRYRTVSWRSAEKAIALAVFAHLRRHPEANSGEAILDVEVEDLGPVGRNQGGRMVLEAADLIDRMEF